MKKLIALIFSIILVGCSNNQGEANIMVEEFSKLPFYAEGTLIQGDETYEIKVRREGDIKTITLKSEKISEPLTYTLEQGGLSMDGNGKDIIKLECEKIPENCLALLIWEGFDHLSEGSSKKTPEGFTITKQDRAVATATKDKKILTIIFPTQQYKLSFNHFEYLKN